MGEDEKKVTPPAPSVSAHTIKLADEEFSYRAESGWLTLYKSERPAAHMFYSFYETEAAKSGRRPITFVFNGGPGAASAYLHVGALGPRRVVFNADGSAPPPPAELTDNEETWLSFTDLVFIDPIGTGFSRPVIDEEPKDDEAKSEDDPVQKKSKDFWKINRDLKSLSEFIAAFLSSHHRWESPAFLAGESYGGFRGAKLARMLQESYGVGLNGIVLISPALEFAILDESDYDVLPWVDRIPTMAAAAAFHKKISGAWSKSNPDKVMQQAREFATKEFASLLIRGDWEPDGARRQILHQLAGLVGLPDEVVQRVGGRIASPLFARTLLRDEGLVCGLYDASMTAADPFPGRDSYEGPIPTLGSFVRLFASGINAHLRTGLGVESERLYHLLSREVNKEWQVDIERHALESQIGATDDLRYAMTLNPHMKVRITHGIYDLVTPFAASDRIAALLFLNDQVKPNLTLKHYPGGHMFYVWDESRREFALDIGEFYAEAASIER